MAVLNTARPSFREDVNPSKKIWHIHRLRHGLKIYLDAWRAMQDFKPDIVHIQSAGPDLSAVRDMLFIPLVSHSGRRIIFQQHFWADPAKFNGPRSIYKFFYKRLIPRCDAVLMSTPLHTEQAARLIRVDRVYYIPNTCVPPENLHRRCTQDEEAMCQVVYVGRLSQLKGTYDLIAGIELLKTAPIPFRFVLTGVGATVEDDQRIADLISQRGLSERIVLTGRVSEDKKWEILNQSHIMVFPSLSEQFPVALIEGMAAGLPIVTTSVDYLPRLIVHGENGLTVPASSPENLAKAILELGLNPETRKRMSKANYLKFQREFALNVVTDKLRRVYKSVLSNAI